MTVAAVASFIIALVKAVPIIGHWVDELTALYVAGRIEKMEKEHRDGIKKAINEQDQRDLEIAIGSPHAGEASGLPGAVIVDSLPGVVHKSKRD